MTREPVAIASALRLILVAVAAFGVGLEPEQIVAVVAAVEAVTALFVRSKVTPTG